MSLAISDITAQVINQFRDHLAGVTDTTARKRLSQYVVRLVSKAIHYGLIGLSGLAVNLAVFHMALWAGVAPAISNDIAIAVSICSNFTIAALTRLFPPQAGLRAHALKFVHWAGISLTGIVGNVLVFHFTLGAIGASVANLVATLTGMAISFMLATTTKLFPV